MHHEAARDDGRACTFTSSTVAPPPTGIVPHMVLMIRARRWRTSMPHIRPMRSGRSQHAVREAAATRETNASLTWRRGAAVELNNFAAYGQVGKNCPSPGAVSPSPQILGHLRGDIAVAVALLLGAGAYSEAPDHADETVLQLARRRRDGIALRAFARAGIGETASSGGSSPARREQGGSIAHNSTHPAFRRGPWHLYARAGPRFRK